MLLNNQISRRIFLHKSTKLGLGVSFVGNPLFASILNSTDDGIKNNIPVIKKGQKQIFADNNRVSFAQNIERKIHQANKLEQPVLEADMPWEQGDFCTMEKETAGFMFMVRC